MASILIRNLDEATKRLLRRRAERKGKSLDADLRDTLEQIARSEGGTPDDVEPFGSWLVSISRPGFELDETLDLLRHAPVRPASVE